MSLIPNNNQVMNICCKVNSSSGFGKIPELQKEEIWFLSKPVVNLMIQGKNYPSSSPLEGMILSKMGKRFSVLKKNIPDLKKYIFFTFINDCFTLKIFKDKNLKEKYVKKIQEFSSGHFTLYKKKGIQELVKVYFNEAVEFSENKKLKSSVDRFEKISLDELRFINQTIRPLVYSLVKKRKKPFSSSIDSIVLKAFLEIVPHLNIQKKANIRRAALAQFIELFVEGYLFFKGKQGILLTETLIKKHFPEIKIPKDFVKNEATKVHSRVFSDYLMGQLQNPLDNFKVYLDQKYFRPLFKKHVKDYIKPVVFSLIEGRQRRTLFPLKSTLMKSLSQRFSVKGERGLILEYSLYIFVDLSMNAYFFNDKYKSEKKEEFYKTILDSKIYPNAAFKFFLY